MKIELQCGDCITIPKGCKAVIKYGCVVFEKEESKEQEFKRGDVIVSTMNEILIVDVHSFENRILRSFVNIKEDGTLFNSSDSSWNEYHAWRLATEDEKQKLFDKMKEQGLRWNAEKKRVEKIRWRAEKGRHYYYVDPLCCVTPFVEANSYFDVEHWELGNYFRTEKECQEAAERLKEFWKKTKE